MQHTYCVIMAGGVGSRFWPMSKTKTPKQFLDFLGTGQSLIQQTFDRFLPICPKENILVVTNGMYKNQVLEQIPSMTDEQILCEPLMRNTAPCIAYAVYKIAQKDPDANIIISPADHLIVKQAAFENVMNKALNFASSSDVLVTLGITPTRPDTGYGYIQETPSDSEIKKVKQFKEKPDLATAKTYMESGEYSWNSGMFVWSAKSILNAFEKHLPQIATIFNADSVPYFTENEQEHINTHYGESENISIDYGIMEKADNVHVISADIGWSDLGTWGSIYTHLPLDDNNNAVVGNKVMMKDSTGCMVNVPTDKVVVLQGLEDHIIVDTPEILMVVKKDQEQEIKPIRNAVGNAFGKEFI